MVGEEVAVVAIVFGTVLTIVFLGIVGSIIKTWIKRGSDSGDLSKNKEFLSALREFKEKTDQRLSNIEAIVAKEHPKKSVTKKSLNQKEHSSSIEIELNNEPDKEESSKSGNLRNMLNQ